MTIKRRLKSTHRIFKQQAEQQRGCDESTTTRASRRSEAITPEELRRAELMVATEEARCSWLVARRKWIH